MSEFNEKLIIEIGINHLGDEHYFMKYVELIIKLKLKYVTIQIQDEKFYKEDKNISKLAKKLILSVIKK